MFNIEYFTEMILPFVLTMVYSCGISLGVYVLQALSFYAIAKRRGLRHAWLSWVPVGSSWILGCISDQYQYVVNGKIKNKRKALLVLSIIMWIAYIVISVVGLGLLVQIADRLFDPFSSQLPDIENAFELLIMEFISPLMLMSLAYFVISGVSIAITVIHYICLYDLFASCEPKNKVLYLVLSILVTICQPVFLFLCRKKDEGMPPRRVEPWEE